MAKQCKLLVIFAATFFVLPNTLYAVVIDGSTVRLTASDHSSDNTELIQSYLDNSDYTRIILSPGPGGASWRVRPLFFRHDNTELKFWANVVLEAMPGGYPGDHDSVLQAKVLDNIRIIGSPGSEIRMHKEEYGQVPNVPGEWRTAVDLRGCSNVLVSSFTISNTGGDGVYVGPAQDASYCSSVRIQFMTIDGCARNGISVISVDGLVILGCVIKNTRGLPGVSPEGPWAGIDFEPDFNYERLKNITVRECDLINNGMHGVLVATHNLEGSYRRLQLHVRDCTIVGSGISGIETRYMPESLSPHSYIAFTDCDILDSQEFGAYIGSKAYHGGWLYFADCMFANNNLSDSIPANFNDAAIVIYNFTNTTEETLTGNIGIFDVTVVPPSGKTIPYVVKMYGENTTIKGVWGDVFSQSGELYEYKTESIGLTLHR